MINFILLHEVLYALHICSSLSEISYA